MEKLELTIVTPSRKVYADNVDQITITTKLGEITILPKHIPLVSRLNVGHVTVKKGEEEIIFAIDGGVVEVRHDHSVVVLSDNSEHIDEIDIEKAEEAMRKAEEYMKKPKEIGFDYTKLQAKLAKEQNRARLARRGHRR